MEFLPCNPRVILAAFAITAFPDEAFSDVGELKTNVMKSAAVFLENYNAIVDTLLTSETKSFSEVPENLTQDFASKILTYHRDFAAWKVTDEHKLALRIKYAIIALTEARDYLPSNEPADSLLSLEFETQLNRLYTKFGALMGLEALQSLRNDLAASATASDAANSALANFILSLGN
jgi:hypothetical protein